jgi:hypothetical protein
MKCDTCILTGLYITLNALLPRLRNANMETDIEIGEDYTPIPFPPPPPLPGSQEVNKEQI